MERLARRVVPDEADEFKGARPRLQCGEYFEGEPLNPARSRVRTRVFEQVLDVDPKLRRHASTRLQTGAVRQELSCDRNHEPTTFLESYTIPQELPACHSTANGRRKINQSLTTF